MKALNMLVLILVTGISSTWLLGRILSSETELTADVAEPTADMISAEPERYLKDPKLTGKQIAERQKIYMQQKRKETLTQYQQLVEQENKAFRQSLKPPEVPDAFTARVIVSNGPSAEQICRNQVEESTDYINDLRSYYRRIYREKQIGEVEFTKAIRKISTVSSQLTLKQCMKPRGHFDNSIYSCLEEAHIMYCVGLSYAL